jgi:Retrotransposon gag protein
MTALPGYPVFKANADFEIFMERLHNAFIVNKTPDTDRVAILLNQIDEHVYKTLRNLCDPETPGTKTFDEIHSLLRRQYVRETSAWKERRKFFNAVQKRTESVNEWFLRLKTLATNCDFGKDLPEMLKNKFVCGLDQSAIFERIAEESCNVTMDTILQIAINKEAVLPKPTEKKEQAKPVEPKSAQPKPAQPKPAQPRPAQQKASPAKNWTPEKPVDSGPKTGPRKPQNQKPKNCWHCGLPDHDFKQCQHRTSVCMGCQQVGHIRSICRGMRPATSTSHISINL